MYSDVTNTKDCVFQAGRGRGGTPNAIIGIYTEIYIHDWGK